MRKLLGQAWRTAIGFAGVAVLLALLVTACGQLENAEMGVDAGIANAAIEDAFQLAVADIQETFSVVLSSEYEELESQTGQTLIRK